MMVRAVILYVVVLIALGAVWPALRSFGIDGLPGDFSTQFGTMPVTVPIASAALVSIAVGALFWLTGRRS